MAVVAAQAHSQSSLCGSLQACGSGEAATMKGLSDKIDRGQSQDHRPVNGCYMRWYPAMMSVVYTYT